VVPVAVFLAHSAAHPTGFGLPGLWGALGVSAEAATISTGCLGLLGVPLAYLLAHHRGRLAKAAGLLVQLPMALPPLMSGVVLLYVFGPDTALGRLAGGRFTESLLGVVLAQSFVSAPFVVVAARSAFATVDPALEDMAATAGMGPLGRFTLVAVPVAGPGIRAGLVLGWLRAFGEYGATVMLAYHPYSLPVFTYVQFSAVGLPATQAPALLSLALATAVVLVARVPLARGRRALQLALTERRREQPPNRTRRPTNTQDGPAGRPAQGRGAGGASPARPGHWLATRATPPGPARSPVPVSLRLSVRTGRFHLEVSHRAGSHRLAVVGPSGAGKSLTLRALAGLLPGDVTFGTEPVGHLPPEQRGVGYVPQGQALLPHLDAWHNVVLGPRACEEDALYWMDALEIAELAGRLPHQMSGGQRQRVALARAFACRPRLLLLDEPFTGLDAPARTALLHRLRELQLRAGSSSVLVSHDFREAALLADEVVVLSNGRVLQAGRTGEVARAPASPEVAGLLGWRNILPGTVDGPAVVAAGGARLATGRHGLATGRRVEWAVQPSRVRLLGSQQPGAVPGRLADTADLGNHVLCLVELGPGLVVEVDIGAGEAVPGRGADCWAYAPPDAFTVWEARPQVARR
jgi:molybdate transport system permease protein